VESVDDSVGRLREALKRLQLEGNTIFIFTSDNGGLSGTVGAQGWRRGPTDNSPLRWGKGGAYDGGVRVPLIVAWPDKVPAGTVCDVPVISYDFMPTLLDATQTPLRDGQVVDGESLLPLLMENGLLKRDAIYWHYPHYHPGSATPYSAVREGDWKLVHFYEDDRVELYNLRRDPGEMQNVQATEGDVTQRLTAKLQAWIQEVGAQEPAPNDAYDPEKAWEAVRKARKK
jgi:arylsulfatase A